MIQFKLPLLNKYIFFWLGILIVSGVITEGKSQSTKPYDLQKLLKENKLATHNKKVVPIQDGTKAGISCPAGVIWLKDVSFSKGTIEIDLRGKNIEAQSFLGIAFHGVDTLTYDAIYFRPFNFRSTDSLKRIHMVQYISHPTFTWRKLREEHPGQYEKGITPPPAPEEWLHARIVVTEKEIMVFVNRAPKPSLTVTKLNDRQDGMIGLWAFALPGDFANLSTTITK